MQDPVRPSDDKSSVSIMVGGKERALNTFADVITLLNNDNLVSQLDADGISGILLFAEKNKEVYGRYGNKQFHPVINIMLGKEELRKKLLASHVITITNLDLSAAKALYYYEDVFNKYASNIILALATNKKYNEYPYSATLTSLFEVFNKSKIYETLTPDAILAVIKSNGCTLMLIEEILASKKVREKLDADSIIKIITANLFFDLPVVKYEDLSIKLSPATILVLEDKYFCGKTLLSYPSVIELWLSGAQDAIKDEEKGEKRLEKAKVMLEKLEKIYRNQLENSPKEFTKVKKIARMHLVALIKNSGLDEEQQKELVNSVEKNTDSVIYSRSILPNAVSRFFSTKTAVDFRNEFKEFKQPAPENKQDTKPKNLDQDVELHEVATPLSGSTT